MFTAKLGEAVIGAEEEVVTADMVIVIVWRPMGRYGLGQLSPLQLDGVRQLLPGKDGTVMDLSLVQLGCGTTILGIGLALVEALAVTVIEGDVTYAGPAVLDYGCGMEFGHGFIVLVILYKVIDKKGLNLPSTSKIVYEKNSIIIIVSVHSIFL